MATTYDPQAADLGEIYRAPREVLVIDPNVRKDIRLDKSFISSIRVRGFEQYPVGYKDGDQVHVTVGQRRVSAALEIGWPVIPIVVKPRAAAEADRLEELRLLTQLAENEQRSPLTEAESAGAYKQLALIGVSEDQIARKTNSPKERVTTALKVVDSKAALAAIEKHPITLEQAAILVEFEDDQQALAELQEFATTRPEQLEHAAQRLRSQAARNRSAQSIADKARTDGWKVIFRDPKSYEYSPPAGHTRVQDLWRTDDPKKVKLTLEDLPADQPGRVVWIDAHGGFRDEPRVEWLIKDHKKHGFSAYSDSYSTGKGPLTDEEKAARRQKRTDKAEMTDATVVRRTWIKDNLLQSKLDVDVVLPWITVATLGLPAALGYDQAAHGTARELAAELLGLEMVGATKYSSGDDRATLAAAVENTGTQARLRVTLAFAIALVEHVAGHQRHPAYGQYTKLAPYFEQLQTWGYTLADVEQRIVDGAKKGRRK